jgi:DNA-binding MarR family transcriptional regulator
VSSTERPLKQTRERAQRESGKAGQSASARESSALGVALDFMRLLWAVDHGLQRRSKRMEVELGVTGMQRIVIRLIGRYPDIAAGRLAELVHVHPSTLTGVLRRLVERGFVHRERDPKDGRRSRLALLPPGNTIDATQAGTVEAAVRRALARVPAESVDAARFVLAAVAEELARSDR